MKSPQDKYWRLRLARVKEALENNNFRVFLAENAKEAHGVVMEQILPRVNPDSISWGGSMTFLSTGLYDDFKGRADLTVIDTYDKTLSMPEMLERRRQALLVDLFITGTNALTEQGDLVNLDMIGNRVAAITFGPRNVIVLVGRNKLVPDLESAIERVKAYSAPVNVQRLTKKTPCLKTGHCEDCKSSERICNYWSITEKSFPKERINVVLINEDLGF
jgi:L-lactate utilization protein LutB